MMMAGLWDGIVRLNLVCTEKSIQLGTGEGSHEEADSAHSLGRC